MSAPDLRDFMRLFREFEGSSWDGWRDVLARLTPAVREFYAACGRGSGKSRIAALLACAFAARDYRLVSGENIYIAIFAPDKKQSRITFNYVVGLLRSVPALAALIVAVRKESVDLSNGIIVEVLSATIAAPRGRAYALAIVEEAAFLPTDQSANPDVELLRSLRPGLGRVAGSLLAIVSSPYARRGCLWSAWRKYHDQPDSDVVFLQAPTLELNPTFDRRTVEKALEDDPASAGAEYLAQFRSDVETFIVQEAIDAAVVPGRHELAPMSGLWCSGFADFAGGGAVGADSAAAAVAREELREGDRSIVVLDALREVRPPFSPEQVCEDFAAFFKSYGVEVITADRWAGQFPVEQMRKHGIAVRPSERSKSDIYKEFLPLLNSGRVELLDVPRLHTQLAGLERTTHRGGRDNIDHSPGGKDDVANAACGALVEASLHPTRAYEIGHAATADRPDVVTTLEQAERVLVERQAARDATALRITTAQQALNQFHDEHSAIGPVRRVWRSVEPENDTDGTATHDSDPWT